MVTQPFTARVQSYCIPRQQLWTMENALQETRGAPQQ